MSARKPHLAGSKAITRRATGRERSDCRWCAGPFTDGQLLIMVPDELAWAHAGCQHDHDQEKAGQLAFWRR